MEQAQYHCLRSERVWRCMSHAAVVIIRCCGEMSERRAAYVLFQGNSCTGGSMHTSLTRALRPACFRQQGIHRATTRGTTSHRRTSSQHPATAARAARPGPAQYRRRAAAPRPRSARDLRLAELAPQAPPSPTASRACARGGRFSGDALQGRRRPAARTSSALAARWMPGTKPPTHLRAPHSSSSQVRL